MQADIASLNSDADQRQVETLCEDLNERAETAQQEQVLLEQLVDVTARTRPYRSRQYRMLLERVGTQYRRLRELIIRYCT
jgi:hypothetical protein